MTEKDSRPRLVRLVAAVPLGLLALSRLDLRVAGAICQLCDVTLAELVDFSTQPRLQQLKKEKQQRLDVLMEKNNEGKLGKREQRELQDLVRETQEITLHNARVLADHQRRLEK